MSFRLTAAYVEVIHDVLVPQHMSFDEPVEPNKFKDLGLLDSSVNRPFQTFDGQELHGTIFAKAAALFHSLACNHCFYNGNKRTAVIALDMFLCSNDYMLAANNKDIYELAVSTAKANSEGKTVDEVLGEISEKFRTNSLNFDLLAAEHIKKIVPELLAKCIYTRDRIRNHPLNQMGEENVGKC